MAQDLIKAQRALDLLLENFHSSDPVVAAKALALRDKVFKHWESYSSNVSGTFVSNEQALKSFKQDKEIGALLRAYRTGKQPTKTGSKPYMRLHFTQDVWENMSYPLNTDVVVGSNFRLSSDDKRLPVANVGASIWTAQHLLSPLLQAQTDLVSDYDTTADFIKLFTMPGGTASTYPIQGIQGRQQGIEFTEAGVYMVTCSLDVALKPRSRFNYKTTPTLELIDQTHGTFADLAKLGILDDEMPKLGLGVMLFKDGYISKDVTASGPDATPWFNPALCRYATIHGPWTMMAAGSTTGRVMRVGFSQVMTVNTGDNLLLSLMRDKGKLTYTGNYASQDQVVQVQQKFTDAIVIAKQNAPGSARSARDTSNVLEITRIGDWV